MEQFLNSNGSIENNNDLMVPPTAGFWRRVAAFVIDSLLLGILGQIIGWSASSYWFTIGPNGRILGLIVVLTYFGLTYSKVSNGQTVGKRLLKIAVRDKNNKPISIQHSLLRVSILAFPALLNGWALPVNIAILDWFFGIIVFGVGAAVVYTMLFNRGSRQGIHDLICGTYVVHLKGEPIEAFPHTAKKHWIISGALVAVAIVIVTSILIFGGTFISKVGLSNIADVQEVLTNDSRFHTIGVSDNTLRGVSNTSPGGFTVRSIKVEVWYKGVPSDEEYSEVMNGE